MIRATIYILSFIFVAVCWVFAAYSIDSCIKLSIERREHQKYMQNLRKTYQN